MLSIESKYPSGMRYFSQELAGYFVDYIPNKRNHLVITFENAHEPKKPRTDPAREPWGAVYLYNRGFSILGVKPKVVDWYRGADLHAFFRSPEFQDFRSGFEQVTLYGSSMGGFGALTFAEVCPGCRVIALNPQTSLDRTLVPWETRFGDGQRQDWTGDFADARIGAQAAEKVYVAYDPLLALDRRHVERLHQANVVPFKMPLVEHVLVVWMADAGVLTPFLEGALAGTLTAAECNRLARGRRNTARYFLAWGCGPGPFL